MIKVSQIKLPPGHTGEDMDRKLRKLLRLTGEEALQYRILKKSLDARKKPQIFYEYTLEVKTKREEEILKRRCGSNVSRISGESYQFPASGDKKLSQRPVIVGMGPAGLFCAYLLAEHGYCPILLERGEAVEQRIEDVNAFWAGGRLDPDSNVQFGEGGAGTFSDGKLNTLIKDKTGKNKEVLSILVREGAPEEVLFDSKPHIGTDILARVVKNMRQTILNNGGEVIFRAKMTGLIVEEGCIKGVVTKEKTYKTKTAVLALGHSARDTFEMLHHMGIPMAAKSFAVGFRVEHRQSMINEAQYGTRECEYLPPASYKLTASTKENRGVYSFCMCPGGYVVDASSEEGRLAVNGMSYSKRDGVNANSAVIVTVTPEDFPDNHPLSGMEFQRQLEEKAYQAGKGSIPVQRFGDFKAAVGGSACPEAEGKRAYEPSIKGIWKYADLSAVMPEALNRAFVEGMEIFDRIIPGFGDSDVLLSGVESRTSSPVKIFRDEWGQSMIRGLYPCGEGAGYAGGITSAAMDGIRTAEHIAEEYMRYLEGNQDGK